MKILWIGDAACHTGFATVTHSVLQHLHERHDVHVCGINYHGDPHEYPYPIYPAGLGGDQWGVGRFDKLCTQISPDVVLINNDPWNVVRFLTAYRSVPIVAYMPIDGLNMNRQTANYLDRLTCAIWYTDFGKKVAEDGGFCGKSEVVPHGVDTVRFRPIDKAEARKAIGMTDGFIVGNINRNQLRKRMDLTIQAFALAIKEYGIQDAWLYLHCAERDEGVNIPRLAEYYGVADRVLTPMGKNTFHGVDYELMPYVYNSLDVQITTSMGEGWGLTTMEGMACGVPQVIPYHSALAEWPSVVDYVAANDDFVMPYGINMVCKVPAIRDIAYRIRKHRDGYLQPDNRNHVCQDKFKWSNIADRFETILRDAVDATDVARKQNIALQMV